MGINDDNELEEKEEEEEAIVYRRGAASAVHALRVTKCRAAMLTHVAFGALANLLVIAPPSVGAFLVAFRIRTYFKYAIDIIISYIYVNKRREGE